MSNSIRPLAFYLARDEHSPSKTTTNPSGQMSYANFQSIHTLPQCEHTFLFWGIKNLFITKESICSFLSWRCQSFNMTSKQSLFWIFFFKTRFQVLITWSDLHGPWIFKVSEVKSTALWHDWLSKQVGPPATPHHSLPLWHLDVPEV